MAVVVAIVALFGALTIPFPSLMSSELQLPVSVIAPLGLPIVLAWALSSSDPRLELGTVRRLGALDVALAVGWCGLAAVTAVILTLPGSPEAGLIAARATIGYVGLLLCARWVLPTDAAAAVPIGYVLLVSFLAGGSMRSAPPWAWAIRPTGDMASWLIPAMLLLLGAIVLWRYPGGIQHGAT